MKTRQAVVLAGGQSSRMGFDKQRIRLDGEYLVHRNLRKLGQLFDQVAVVTNTPGFYQGLAVQTLADIYPGHGPMSGIHAGLRGTSHESVYFMAVDMPVVDEGYISYVDGLYQADKDGIVISRSGRIEPMQGIYHKRLVDPIEELIADQDYRITSLVDRADFIILEEDKLPELLDTDRIFTNLNTQDDLEEFNRGI